MDKTEKTKKNNNGGFINFKNFFDFIIGNTSNKKIKKKVKN